MSASAPRIGRDAVLRAAALARLDLTEAEIENLTGDLDRILGYAESLREIDTTGIPPTTHVLSFATPMRDDAPAPPLAPERAVANAPRHEGSAFVVPKVIDGEEEG
jgi:aspartyl-tRNA(Asn)/glutamyl-tRNA(Gln) amidotransferase subunit C